jgi:hypothetical protein
MRFELEQGYAADADAVARAYADPDLYETFAGLPKLGAPEIVDHHVDGASVRLDIRYHFTGRLSSAVTAVIDPRKLSWVEQSTHDLEHRRTKLVLVPDHYRDRLRCRADVTVKPVAGGAVRHISGEIKVRAPLVASRVERAIVSGLDEHLAGEAALVEAFVEDRIS